MDNLELYNKVAEVPATAKKAIQAGRLKGKTDINPMWRIKVLTEQFGICGIGWKYDIEDVSVQDGANQEKAMFVTIKLYIKKDGEWSDGIMGVGGNMLITKESKGLRSNDEALKMATTDAISVACKQLGIGANVYWSQDGTKYTGTKNQDSVCKKSDTISESQLKRLYAISKGKATEASAIIKKYGYEKGEEIKKTDYNKICKEIEGIKNV